MQVRRKIQHIIIRKNLPVYTDLEMTQKIELLDKDIKTITATIFYMFKK